MKKTCSIFSCFILVAFMGLSFAFAADYPTKPILLVTPFPAGGNADQLARALAEEAEKVLGQKIVVTPQPGAGMITAVTKVQKSKADGYTLLFAPHVAFTVLPHRSDAKYTKEDFVQVCATYLPNTILGAKQGRFKDIQEVIEYAKANPGKLNVAVIGNAGPHTILIRQLEKDLGIQLQVVPFQDGPGTVAAVLGEHADLVVTDNYNEALDALLCTSPERAPRYPNAPTVFELGFDNQGMTITYVVSAPKGTDKAVIAKLNDAFKASLVSESVRERSSKLNWLAFYQDASAADKVIELDFAITGQLVKDKILVLE